MAHKYQQQFKVPPELPDTLSEFCREVLRDQPENIYFYGFKYFADKSAGSDGQMNEAHGSAYGSISPSNAHQSAPPPTSGIDLETLSHRIAIMFDEADADKNGYLTRREIQVAFDGLAEELGLSEKDVLRIVSEFDENEDGIIEYQEFVPMAADIVTTLLAKEEYEARTAMRKQEAVEEARSYLLKGVPRHELEESIRDVFRNADKDGNGTLDRSEFLRCIRESGLGFTRREVNMMLTMVDRNSDGKISYEEFVPVCFNMLLELVSDTMQIVPSEEKGIRDRLLRLLETTAKAQRMENEGNSSGGGGGGGFDEGRIGVHDALMVLRQADLGLTHVQLHAIMSEVPHASDGSVSYIEVAEVASGVMMALKNLQRETEKAEVMEKWHQSDDYNLVYGLNRDDFTDKLAEAVYVADEAETGALPLQQVREAIGSVFPSLDQKQLQALLVLCPPIDSYNSNGGGDNSNNSNDPSQLVNYNEMIKWGFMTLQRLHEQQMLIENQQNIPGAPLPPIEED